MAGWVPDQRHGPILPLGPYRNEKDPCPVHDGRRWHLFGTAHVGAEARVFHAVAEDLTGPWTMAPEPALPISGPRVAAPGVLHEHGVFHLFIQTTCFALGGTIEYLTSRDGDHWTHEGAALTSLPGTDEAGIYDGHPARLGGIPHLVYAGMSAVGRPDLFLARSRTASFAGPWERLGPILRHAEVPHHNQLDHADYEWGLEGPQLVELDGGILLIAVCFLPGASSGTRQRVFFAEAPSPAGPYRTTGITLPATDPWASGETGHAAAVRHDGRLTLFYQARPADGPWQIGIATFLL